MRVLTVIALLLVFTSSSAKSIDKKIILGDWCAGSKNAYHEEFELVIEDGEHKFYSWLHSRPAIFGVWKLKNKTLSILGSSGDKYIYTVDKVTSDKLVLQEEGEPKEIYVRHNCIRFEEPPTE
ncbi:MAG TPA: hypothetical protein VKA50_13915 [Gammaproteobacteria bacterium]|nr:hypothetical protein [Gammaproteobacteria bacterium]